MNGSESVDVTIVLPVYRGADCLNPLYERLKRTLDGMRVSHEILFVDDGSPDDAWQRISAIAERDVEVRALRMSRNFGQHAAITAGLAESRGQRVIVMDADLQESPEEIPRLYEAANAGFDVVLTRRRSRAQALPRRIIGRSFLRAVNVLAGTVTDINHGTMSLLSRAAVDSFLMIRDVHREFLAVVYWLGFDRTTIDVEHHPRHEGQSSYSLRALALVGRSGLLFQTTRLLHLVTFAGMATAFAGFAVAVYYLYSYAVSDPLPGYTSLAVLILILSGAILCGLGVVGLYVGATFDQARGRPLFVVAETIPFGNQRGSQEIS